MRRNYYTGVSHCFIFSMFTSSKKEKADRFRIHKHTETEIGYIIRGSGTYILENNCHQAGDSDFFLIRPNEQHCVPTITTPEFVSFNIHISPYYIWNICSNYISVHKLRAFVDPKIPITSRFHADTSAKNIFAELRSLLNSETADNKYRVNLLVLELMVHIASSIEAPASADETADAHIDDIQSAIQYINNNIAEQIKLSDIANAVNICETALISSFRAITGMTPYKYLILQRIEKAVELLRETDKTVLDIAQRCGFQNNVTFNRAFKQVTGLTPSECRRMRTDHNR